MFIHYKQLLIVSLHLRHVFPDSPYKFAQEAQTRPSKSEHDRQFGTVHGADIGVIVTLSISGLEQ